jgi:two-component system chemotaxis sensor kinase CheA
MDARSQSDSLTELFVTETRDLLQQMEDDLLQLEGAPDDADVLNALFRVVHTVKGSAGTVNEPAIVAFTHVFENVMDRLRKGEIRVDPALASVLLAGKDVLERMVDEVKGQRSGASVPGLDDATRGLHRYASLSRVAEGATAAPRADGVERVYRIDLRLREDLFDTGQDPYLLLLDLAELGRPLRVEADLSALPDFDQLDPLLLHARWRVLLATREPRGRLEDVFVFVKDEADLRIREVMKT